MTRQHIEIAAVYPDRTIGRTCGSCTSCCTFMGVNELHKHTGVKCSHLSPPSAGSKRCSIYKSRPVACKSYQCFWLSGFGPEHIRPNKSGILITPYNGDTDTTVAFTVMIFNKEKARPHIHSVLAQLIGLSAVTEVRLIYWETMRGTHFKHGEIFDCNILPQRPGSYESLTFTTSGEPVGTYSIRKEEPA